MNDIKVSIVIPVYNAEKYIRQQLDSLIAQTYKNMEIICVNDGSTDGTEKILAEYSEKYNFITTHLKPNGGVSSARNLGIRYATGKYLIFLDADDFCCENMLEEVVDAAESTGAEIVIFDAYRFDECAKQVLKDNFSYTYGSGLKYTWEISDDLYKTIRSVVWNKLFLRRVIIENELLFPLITLSEDVVFNFETVTVVKTLFILNKKLIYYRIGNTNSLTHKLNEMPYAVFEALNILKEKLISRGVFEQYKYSFYTYGISFIPMLIAWLNDKCKFKRAIGMFIKYIREAISNDCLSDLGFYKTHILENSNIVIYGAGQLSLVLVKYFTWYCGIDTDKIFIVVSANQIKPIQLCGIDIKSVDEFIPYELRHCLIAVTTESAVQAIKKELDKRGVIDYVEFGVKNFASLLVGEFDG